MMSAASCVPSGESVCTARVVPQCLHVRSTEHTPHCATVRCPACTCSGVEGKHLRQCTEDRTPHTCHTPRSKLLEDFAGMKVESFTLYATKGAMEDAELDYALFSEDIASIRALEK